MRILLCRHGIAEEIGPDGRDASRRLTPQGVERTTQAARGLATIVEPPQLLLCSPKARAMQTAQIMGSVLGLKPRVFSVLGDGSGRDILHEVAGLEQSSVMLVGHEPTLSHVMCLCLAGAECHASGHCFIQLKKAGIGCIDVLFYENRSVQMAELNWLATPKMLVRDDNVE